MPTLRARNTAASRRDADQGSALPTVLVCVIVALLGAGAVVALRRRRRQA